jgi:hypothetical protein
MMQISSTRSSTTRKNAALVAIEQHLAVLCVKEELSKQFETFISLQDSFETNSEYSAWMDNMC